MINQDLKQQILDDCLTKLEQLSLHDTVEVLGNMFLRIGYSAMSSGPKEVIAKALSEGKVMEAVLDNLKEEGETVANALARQGILLLTWINKEK
jgi:hypothetical protein